ncbi:MAG TPA: DEAD/DEAH box helicase [Candidatus Bathyarchaeia archaeon]|nr:DEAD/DEAH box helicase [Candidatus Bathyarchaeia archaeon]
MRGISILYVTPLRALNRDLLKRLTELGKAIDIKIQVRHGDTSPSARRLQALEPPDMLITTPETLQAIMPGRKMREHLRAVRWVIIDEIHELVSDERGVQLSLALERLRILSGREFQRIGLSATIGNLETVSNFLTGKDKKAIIVKSSLPKNMEFSVESPTPTTEDAKLAEKLMVPAGSIRRIRRLSELIRSHRSTLVFTNTREHAEAIASRMRYMDPDLEMGIHHGSLSRDVRIETEEGFKEGRLKAVICTSSLELGIDIGNVDLVVQVFSPRQAGKLIQRVGRSGHRVDSVPKGRLIASWPDDILESAILTDCASKEVIEPPEIHFNSLDVLAHQLVGFLMDHGTVELDWLYHNVIRAYPYANLATDDLLLTVQQLEDERILRFKEGRLYRNFKKAFQYYYQNLSMIPDVKTFLVKDFSSGRKIGSLDQEFVARNGQPGVEFIMHGQTWKVIGVEEEKSAIIVEPVPQSIGAIPSWEGEIIPVQFEIAQGVGRLRESLSRDPYSSVSNLDDESRRKVLQLIERQVKEGFPIPTDKRILVESFENFVIIHCAFGNKVNETFARALSCIMASKLGSPISAISDPYRIALISFTHMFGNDVKKEFTELGKADLRNILQVCITDSRFLSWRLWHVAKRFGVVDHEADYTSSKARMLSMVLKETPVYKEAFRELEVEKLDLSKAKEVLSAINGGQIEIEVVEGNTTFSPFALPIVDKIAPQDLLRSVAESRNVLEIVKERLDSAKVRLLCIYHGDWEGIRTVKSLLEKVKCPSCNSTLIAVTYNTDTELYKIVQKKLKRKIISMEEEERWLKAWKSASLVQTYGKKAVIALAARGVGPTSAIRVLRQPYRTEENFYEHILRAERQYLATRMFWDK